MYLFKDHDFLHAIFKLFSRLKEEVAFALPKDPCSPRVLALVVHGVHDVAVLMGSERDGLVVTYHIFVHVDNVKLGHLGGDQPLGPGHPLHLVDIGEVLQSL